MRRDIPGQMERPERREGCVLLGRALYAGCRRQKDKGKEGVRTTGGVSCVSRGFWATIVTWGLAVTKRSARGQRLGLMEPDGDWRPSDFSGMGENPQNRPLDGV